MRNLPGKIYRLIAILALVVLFMGGTTPLKVSWDQNSEADMEKYRVYYNPGGTSTWMRFEVPYPDTMWAFNHKDSSFCQVKVAAIDTAGNESGFSETVIVDTRLPTRFGITINKPTRPPVPDPTVLEPIELDVIAHGDESFQGNGWTVWGHEQGNDSGLFVLNPGNLKVTVKFTATVIGNGVCIEEARLFSIDSQVFEVHNIPIEIEFTSGAEQIFINYFDDCWIPGQSDANLRIEGLSFFTVRQ